MATSFKILEQWSDYSIAWFNKDVLVQIYDYLLSSTQVLIGKNMNADFKNACSTAFSADNMFKLQSKRSRFVLTKEGMIQIRNEKKDLKAIKVFDLNQARDFIRAMQLTTTKDAIIFLSNFQGLHPCIGGPVILLTLEQEWRSGKDIKQIFVDIQQEMPDAEIIAGEYDYEDLNEKVIKPIETRYNFEMKKNPNCPYLDVLTEISTDLKQAIKKNDITHTAQYHKKWHSLINSLHFQNVQILVPTEDNLSNEIKIIGSFQNVERTLERIQNAIDEQKNNDCRENETIGDPISTLFSTADKEVLRPTVSANAIDFTGKVSEEPHESMQKRKSKTKKLVATPKSPATTPANGETPGGGGTPAITTTPGADASADVNGGGTTDKSLIAEKPTKDDKDGTKDTNDTKEKDDIFQSHKPSTGVTSSKAKKLPQKDALKPWPMQKLILTERERDVIMKEANCTKMEAVPECSSLTQLKKKLKDMGWSIVADFHQVKAMAQIKRNNIWINVLLHIEFPPNTLVCTAYSTNPKLNQDICDTMVAELIPTMCGGGQSKSKKLVATQKSPATTPANGETPGGGGTPAITTTPGADASADGNGGGTTDKSLIAEKPTKDDKDGTKDTNDTKEKDDIFQSHKHVVRDAKRADEINKHGPVDQKSKDYEILRYDIPSSESLGLPNLEEKEKEKQEAGK
uniref:Uncharacterized protein n=1 Tax=Panagrolaimus davidi TaxID=227884 RepID=A0A914PN35_9BILA